VEEIEGVEVLLFEDPEGIHSSFTYLNVWVDVYANKSIENKTEEPEPIIKFAIEQLQKLEGQ
jgi:hypothetical protein